MDLTGFYGTYRANGQGRAAYDPGMMVALLMYAYARGNRSSRGIERACREDVTYKLITAMRVPDHSTIAEFRRRHEVGDQRAVRRGARALPGGWVGVGWGDRDRWHEDQGERVA